MINFVSAGLVDLAKALRLPLESTPEKLETKHSKTLCFGKHVLVTDYHYCGQGNPSYFAAVYRFNTLTTSCEDPVSLVHISPGMFEDEGHAILWALRFCDAKGES